VLIPRVHDIEIQRVMARRVGDGNRPRDVVVVALKAVFRTEGFDDHPGDARFARVLNTVPVQIVPDEVAQTRRRQQPPVFQRLGDQPPSPRTPATGSGPLPAFRCVKAPLPLSPSEQRFPFAHHVWLPENNSDRPTRLHVPVHERDPSIQNAIKYRARAAGTSNFLSKTRSADAAELANDRESVHLCVACRRDDSSGAAAGGNSSGGDGCIAARTGPVSCRYVFPSRDVGIQRAVDRARAARHGPQRRAEGPDRRLLSRPLACPHDR